MGHFGRLVGLDINVWTFRGLVFLSFCPIVVLGRGLAVGDTNGLVL